MTFHAGAGQPAARSTRMTDAGELLDAAALADAWYAEVLRLGWRLTGSREHGEDIAQEVFLHLHRRGIKLRADGAPLAYLRQMAARRAYRLMKANVTEQLPADDHPDMAMAPAGGSMEQQARLDLILAAVSGLPPKTRAVFILKEVEELETAEVAKLLGILQVTVRRHLMIAHEKIRVKIGEEKKP